MFDPTKVRRFHIDTIRGVTIWREDQFGSVVLSDDYDQLLKLYKNAHEEGYKSGWANCVMDRFK